MVLFTFVDVVVEEFSGEVEVCSGSCWDMFLSEVCVEIGGSAEYIVLAVAADV